MRYKVLFCILMLTSISQLAFSGNPLDEVSQEIFDFVHSYNLMIFDQDASFFDIQKAFYHPDAVWPGGESNLAFVVSQEYSITDVVSEIMDINFMNPKEELIRIVTVKYNSVAEIVNGVRTNQSEEIFEKLFLAEYEGSYKIMMRQYDNYRFFTEE